MLPIIPIAFAAGMIFQAAGAAIYRNIRCRRQPQMQTARQMTDEMYAGMDSNEAQFVAAGMRSAADNMDDATQAAYLRAEADRLESSMHPVQ